MGDSAPELGDLGTSDHGHLWCGLHAALSGHFIFSFSPPLYFLYVILSCDTIFLGSDVLLIFDYFAELPEMFFLVFLF